MMLVMLVMMVMVMVLARAGGWILFQIKTVHMYVYTLYKKHHSIYFWILDDVQEGAVHYAPKFCLRGGQRRKNNKILPCVQSL